MSEQPALKRYRVKWAATLQVRCEADIDAPSDEGAVAWVMRMADEFEHIEHADRTVYDVESVEEIERDPGADDPLAVLPGDAPHTAAAKRAVKEYNTARLFVELATTREERHAAADRMHAANAALGAAYRGELQG